MLVQIDDELVERIADQVYEIRREWLHAGGLSPRYHRIKMAWWEWIVEHPDEADEFRFVVREVLSRIFMAGYDLLVPGTWSPREQVMVSWSGIEETDLVHGPIQTHKQVRRKRERTIDLRDVP